MAVLLYHYKLSCIILGLAIFSFTVLVVLKTTAYYTGNSGNMVIYLGVISFKKKFVIS